MVKTVFTYILLAAILGMLAYIIFTDFKVSSVAGEKSTDTEVDTAAILKAAYSTFDIPEQLDFAGEPMPLDDMEVKERMDRELHINSYWHSSTLFLIKKSARWLPLMLPILKEQNVPEDFIFLPLIESGLANVRSPADAVGFWQILEGTAKEYGLEVNDEVDERYNPLKSTVAACQYFNKAYGKFGSWTNVAASYNMGMRGLERQFEEQRVNSYYDLLLNEETSRYVFRIVALKEIMGKQEHYGFNIPEVHKYEKPDIQYVIVDSSINDLVAYAQSQGITYKTLKYHNPWLRKKTLTIKKKNDSYLIALPSNASPDA